MAQQIGIRPIPGMFNWATVSVNGKPVSSILYSMSLRKDGACTLSIYQINTDEKHRRNGYAGSLLDAMKRLYRGRVMYILSSYDDSTEAGRRLLYDHGFRHVSNIIVWENKDAVTEGLPDKPVSGNVAGEQAADGAGCGDTVPGDRPLPGDVGAEVPGSGVDRPDASGPEKAGEGGGVGEHGNTQPTGTGA